MAIQTELIMQITKPQQQALTCAAHCQQAANAKKRNRSPVDIYNATTIFSRSDAEQPWS